ncbi:MULTISPECIES: PqqD family protein [unclassified Streptomyces]|uniref:PqqD family protein n=1 Tax=unclassified Streptomyces TaxID=2593676 RepID=UPI0033B47579
MRILPGNGVTSTALASGRLDLRAEGRTGTFRCTPLAASMWFALRRNDGFVDLAVESLAHHWGTDLEKVRTVMDAWSRKLIDTGWLQPAL